MNPAIRKEVQYLADIFPDCCPLYISDLVDSHSKTARPEELIGEVATTILTGVNIPRAAKQAATSGNLGMATSATIQCAKQEQQQQQQQQSDHSAHRISNPASPSSYYEPNSLSSLPNSHTDGLAIPRTLQKNNVAPPARAFSEAALDELRTMPLEDITPNEYGKLTIGLIALNFPFLPMCEIKAAYNSGFSTYSKCYMYFAGMTAQNRPFKLNQTPRTHAQNYRTKDYFEEVCDRCPRLKYERSLVPFGMPDLKGLVPPCWTTPRSNQRMRSPQPSLPDFALHQQPPATMHAPASNATSHIKSIKNSFTPSKGPSEHKCEIECGCCYMDYEISGMVQCPDAHLFCVNCARLAAETHIGLRKTKLACISSDDCVYEFSVSEVRQFLKPETFELWMQMRAQEEIQNAGIQGFTECPFCDFGMIMPTDPNVDRLFHCRNTACEVISCRNCQKKNHLPHNCEQASNDVALDAQHLVEEAMTDALLRTCHKCKAKFFKEEGCNKMSCSCGAIQCYVCRQPVKDYGHFEDNHPVIKLFGKRCPLWEDTLKRNHDEVVTAREKVLKEFKKTMQDVGDIKLDAPSIKAKPSTPPPHQSSYQRQRAAQRLFLLQEQNFRAQRNAVAAETRQRAKRLRTLEETNNSQAHWKAMAAAEARNHEMEAARAVDLERQRMLALQWSEARRIRNQGLQEARRRKGIAEQDTRKAAIQAQEQKHAVFAATVGYQRENTAAVGSRMTGFGPEIPGMPEYPATTTTNIVLATPDVMTRGFGASNDSMDAFSRPPGVTTVVVPEQNLAFENNGVLGQVVPVNSNPKIQHFAAPSVRKKILSRESTKRNRLQMYSSDEGDIVEVIDLTNESPGNALAIRSSRRT